jgi:hypothetical protein
LYEINIPERDEEEEKFGSGNGSHSNLYVNNQQYVKDKPSTSYNNNQENSKRLSVNNSKLQKFMYSETATMDIDATNTVDV